MLVNSCFAVITVNPSTLPAGNCQHLYSQLVTAVGGTSPYTFKISVGALPNGLQISSSGLISGVIGLVSNSTVNFTVQAKDKNGVLGTRAYSMVIANTVLTRSQMTTIWSRSQMPPQYSDVYDTYNNSLGLASGVGTTGATGKTGSTGATGKTGSTGYTGATGATGSGGDVVTFDPLTINGTPYGVISAGTVITPAAVDFPTGINAEKAGFLSINSGDRKLFDASSVASVNWNSRFLINPLATNVMDWNTQRMYDNLGTISLNWDNRTLTNNVGSPVYDYQSGAFYDISAVPSLNYNTRETKDPTNVTSLNWETRILKDNANIYSVDWNTRATLDNSGNSSLNWQSRELIDVGASAVSVGWDIRKLYKTSGIEVLDWQNRALKGSWIAVDTLTVNNFSATISGAIATPSTNKVAFSVNGTTYYFLVTTIP